MANLDTQSELSARLETMRRRAVRMGRVQHAQMMVVAAGLAAFGIVAVAAAMMTTLF